MDYFPHKVELESDFFSFSLPPEPQDSIITVYLGLSVKCCCAFFYSECCSAAKFLWFSPCVKGDIINISALTFFEYFEELSAVYFS